MLSYIVKATSWTSEKLENLLTDLAANYARDLLTGHGLVEMEIDHIRVNSKIEAAIAPVENGEINRSIPAIETPLPQIFVKVIRLDRPSYPTVRVESLGRSTPNWNLWSGLEIVAALCVAGAAIAALLFCLAAIFKS
jgi:hypothetical protein